MQAKKEEPPVNAEKSQVREIMQKWDRMLSDDRLPSWDAFPALPLYMDQVVYLINQYLSPLPQEEEQKRVTPAMINNYVKLGMIPRPEKKRYGRAHLASLIMVCVLKQTMSSTEIKKLIPATPEEKESKAQYEAFSSVFQSCKDEFRQNVREVSAPVLESDADGVSALVFRAAFLSSLSQSLAQLILSLSPEPEEDRR